MPQLTLEECRNCPMYINETSDSVSCKRIKGLISFTDIFPYFDNEGNEITRIIQCKWGKYGHNNNIIRRM